MTGEYHFRRLEALKQIRRIIEPFWADCFNATYPVRGANLLGGATQQTGVESLSSAKAKDAAIYDGTLRICVQKRAAAIFMGLTPGNSQWLEHVIPGLKDEQGKRWLSGADEILWELIVGSNYGATAAEAFVDYGIAGMFPIYIDETEDEESIFNFRLWPLSSCYFADSTNSGFIDTVYREMSLTAEQASADYGVNNLSDETRKLLEKEPDKPVAICQAIYPRTDRTRVRAQAGIPRMPFVSEHFEVKQKKLLRTSGYNEFPVVVPRYLPLANSVYSLGPAYDALPDWKTLNDMKRQILANNEMAIGGLWGALSDNVMNMRSITIGPRKVIMMESKDSFWELKSSRPFSMQDVDIVEMRHSIERTMKTDELVPEQGGQMTLGEFAGRREIVRNLYGPEIERLHVEYDVPLVRRCFGIARRRKKFASLGAVPESLQGLPQIKSRSPFARSQRLEDLAAIDRFEQSMTTLASAPALVEVIDNYDLDAAQKRKAELLGVPAELIRDEAAVKKLRTDRQEAIRKATEEQRKAESDKAVAPVVAKGAMGE